MFDKESEEYRVLDYRIKCGQLPENTEKQKHFKELCLKIVAENKPYFMRYVYPGLMTKYNKYCEVQRKRIINFANSIS